MNREEYVKVPSVEKPLNCFCGHPAELYEYTPPFGHIQKVVMCSNGGHEESGDEGCPLYMPPEWFYKATKREAIRTWNIKVGRFGA